MMIKTSLFSMKTCSVCALVKPLSEYYKHPRMADGYLNKCKDCQKANTKAARLANPDYYRQYDRLRSGLEHRVKARADYAKTEKGKQARNRASGSYNARNPERRAATTALGNAVKNGVVEKQPCCVCGSTESLEGHHPAYSMPLDVIWLCKSHHQQLHNEHDEYTK